MFTTPFTFMAAQAGGPPPILVVGAFTAYKGVTENRIIKLNGNGTKNTSFDNSTGFNNIAETIAIDSAGKIYVGGDFTTYKGVTENRIIKLNADGTKDTSFDNSTGFTPFSVKEIAIT